MEILYPFLKLLSISFVASSVIKKVVEIKLAHEILIHLDVSFQVLSNREVMEQTSSRLQFFLTSKLLGGARCFTRALTPRLAAAGPQMPSVVSDSCGTGLQLTINLSQTVVNKLERAGFEEIQALGASMKKEGFRV